MRPQPEGCGEPKPPGIAFPARCASMRPQPEGCGERISGSGRIFRRLGFNAATARRLWRTDFLEILKAKPQRFSSPQPEGCGELNGQKLIGVARIGLQCGHSPKAVENVRVGELLPRSGDASMRPQPEGCGEQPAPDFERASFHGASMRPQPEGCGERSTLTFGMKRDS